MCAAMGEWSRGKKNDEELCLRDDTCRLNNPDKPLGLSGFCYSDAVFMLQ